MTDVFIIHDSETLAVYRQLGTSSKDRFDETEESKGLSDKTELQAKALLRQELQKKNY